MEIIEIRITIAELVEGFQNNQEEGVYAYGGKLCIRPPYQREFIYNMKQPMAVIDTIQKGLPLNTIYWVQNDDGTYELLDGQQRTMSICTYVCNEYLASWGGYAKAFENLNDDERYKFLNYKMLVYVCLGGTETDRLDWFRTINIAGVELKEQELRNAIYKGTWVTDAKRKFSKTNCLAALLGKGYISGVCLRQDYLQTVLKWISDNHIEAYMSAHQHDDNADELWNYFESVIKWVQTTFPTLRPKMDAVSWGELYNLYKDSEQDPDANEALVARLMQDSDVKCQPGIYQYVLDGDVRHLDIRAFDGNTKRRVYEKQGGVCPICGKHFELSQMEADHITPWKDGGHTVESNCQMLCRECNRRKGAR